MSLFRRIMVLFFGTAIGQAITLLATPFLARIYGPEDFGYFAAVMAIIMIFSGVASLKYESAILINRQKISPESIFYLSFFLLAVNCFLFSILVLLFEKTQIYLSLIPNGLPSYYLIILFFLFGSVNILVAWHTRKIQYRVLAASKSIQAMFTVTGQFVLYPYVGGGGLVYGALLGIASVVFFLGLASIVGDSSLLSKGTSVREIKFAARVHRNFPKYVTLATLLNGLSNQLPSILFARVFSITYAGHFSMSTRLTRSPISLIGQSIFRVVSQHVGYNVDNKVEIQSTISTVFKRMVNFAGWAFVLMSLLIKPAILLILGPNWSVAGEISRLILPWLFFLYLSWPLTSVLNNLGYQKELLLFNAVFVMCLIVPFVGAYFGLSETAVIMFLMILGSLSRIYYVYWTLKSVEIDSLEIMRPAMLYWGLIFIIVMIANGLSL